MKCTEPKLEHAEAYDFTNFNMMIEDKKLN